MKNKQTELRAYHRIGSPEVFNRKLNTDKENKIEVGESFIEEMKIDKGYSYVLKVKGLLTDDMILKFIEGQDDEQVKFILTLCIKYQLTHNF